MEFLIVLFPLTVGLIPGIVGGVTTALAVKWADKSIDTRNFVIILFGWTAGMTIGSIVGGVFYMLSDIDSIYLVTDPYFELEYILRWIFAMTITGMVTSLIGSLTTRMVLESLPKNENAV